MNSFKEEIRVRGKKVLVDAIVARGKVITITGRLLKVARIKDEWYDKEVDDPPALVQEIRDSRCSADIFTFVQRVPDVAPKYAYRNEPVHLAVLPIQSYAHWWDKQISKDVRKKVRKAEKAGVVCRAVEFDDEFARGIAEIYNECPVRQGKPFWHYGKTFEAIRAEASTYLHQSGFIGAYWQGELIGFIKLVYFERCASTMHVIAKIAHRDKAPTNAMVAKAVSMCEERNIAFLSYGEWGDGTLGEFKRHSGFGRVDVPRYYVPITTKGALALRWSLHKGVRAIVPRRTKQLLVGWRRAWHSRIGRLGVFHGADRGPGGT